MIKTLKQNRRAEQERFAPPRSVQKSIPIRRIYRDGIWQVGDSRFSQSYSFEDINYCVASQDVKLSIFLDWSGLLNSLPTDAGNIKITIYNRRINPVDFENTVLMQEQNDGLDHFRRELNGVIRGKTEAQQSIIREKYLTISSSRKNIEDARSYFQRVETGLVSHFGRLSSKARILPNHDRLRILHDFFRAGEESSFHFDLAENMRRGHDFRDYICPDSIQFKSDHFIIGDRVGRVLFLKDYASYIKDSMVSELCELNRDLMLSIDIVPIPTDEAVQEIERKMMALETDAARWQRRQNLNNNYISNLPYEMEQMRKEIKEFYDDMQDDKRMMFVVLSIVHTADTLEQLDADTETLCSTARKNLCQLATLKWRQEDGLNTVLPYGMRKIDALRTLTTEGTAVLMPFYAREIVQQGGAYYGENAVSRNFIFCNRKELMNGNGFYLSTSGGGKSMMAKQEIVWLYLNTDDHIVVIDPENEYAPLVEALGGVTTHIASGGSHHVNAMTISRDFLSDESPIAIKSEAILSLCEQVIGTGRLGAVQKSIIDRCVAAICRGYLMNEKAKMPTLRDFHALLLTQEEPEAKEIALSMELFINGTLDVFAHQTNVNLDNRLQCYDIHRLGKQLEPVGYCVTLDNIQNLVARNRKLGKRTHVFIDEYSILLKNPYTAAYFESCWKRFRKYGAQITGISQNVTELLLSDTARLMLGNSEFLLMLNQSPTDRKELGDLLNISETLLMHITNAQPGHGLIKVGSSIVPFRNDFPADTELYRLMSTKPSERFASEVTV